MLKNISDLGKTLNKSEQKNVNGGSGGFICFSHSDCQEQYDAVAILCINNSCLFL